MLFSGSKLRSITNKSLSSKPAPIIDCPLTFAKKVASLFVINSSSKEIRVSLKSSAGDGNPAEIPASIKIAPFPEVVFGVKKVMVLFFVAMLFYGNNFFNIGGKFCR